MLYRNIAIDCVMAILFFFGWSSLGPLPVASAADNRPNVVLVIADDLNTTIGCYGGDIKTPRLDEFAQGAIRFTRAYCQEAVCGPSRNSLLSGLRPDTTKLRIGRGNGGGPALRKLRPNTITLPELFQNNGYHTVSIGKIFHHGEVETGGPVGPRMPRDELSWSEEPWYHGENYQQWFEPESFRLVEQMRALPEKQRPRVIRGLPYEASDQPDSVYPDTQIADRAIETLQRIKDRPFFLAVGFRRPHLPFNCPQKYWDLYPEEDVAFPSNYLHPKSVPEIALHDSYELRSYAGIPESGPIPDHHLLNVIRGYKAAASSMDVQFGRIIDALAMLGLERNTIVVFTSDHGYHTGENGLWTKMTNFEIATRVPLIVRVPNSMKPGASCEELVELIDIYPSLADLCGLMAPVDLEGMSFSSQIVAPERPGKLAVFTQFQRGLDSRESGNGGPLGCSIVTPQYRYTEWRSVDGTLIGTELYDLVNDPQNNENRAASEEYREVVEKLSRQLAASSLASNR